MREPNTNPTSEDSHSSVPRNDDPASSSDDSASPRRKLSIPYILEPSPSKNTTPRQQAQHTLTTSTANQATPNINANSSNSSNANDILNKAPASTYTASPSGVSHDRDRVQEYHALQAKAAIRRISALGLNPLGLTQEYVRGLEKRDLEQWVRICKTMAASGVRSQEAELKYLEDMLREMPN
ncbi:hypothetical protein B0T09DRAFT_310409 [Sordaria sp. MPI-SDFR-AT-0083]|nr:hypothetical protein B0T09DRAFT_310409 [Sordaria sp. MPI-SDFR-AT-0083]